MTKRPFAELSICDHAVFKRLQGGRQQTEQRSHLPLEDQKYSAAVILLEKYVKQDELVSEKHGYYECRQLVQHLFHYILAKNSLVQVPSCLDS